MRSECPCPRRRDRSGRRSKASPASPPARSVSTAGPDTTRSQGSVRRVCAAASPRRARAFHREKAPYLPCAGRPHEHCAWSVRMRLLFFDDFRLGVLKGYSSVVDVSDVVQAIPNLEPQDLISGLIQRFDEYRRPLEEAAARGQGVSLDSVRVRPPLPRPNNIVCMGVNYMEDGTRSEPAPINAFTKSPNAIVGPGDTMVLPDVAATIFEGEAEVALVMGKHASNVLADLGL